MNFLRVLGKSLTHSLPSILKEGAKTVSLRSWGIWAQKIPMSQVWLNQMEESFPEPGTARETLFSVYENESCP